MQNIKFCSLNGRSALKHLKPPTCFGIMEWDFSFLLSNYPWDWTDVCTYLKSSMPLFLCLYLPVSLADTDTCTETHNPLPSPPPGMQARSGFRPNPHLANYSDLPNCRDHPKASYSECNIPSFPALWRDIQHAPPTPLIGQFSFKWACFASTHFFPHIFQCCGFYWSLSSQGCWCLNRGTQQQLVGLLMVVSPAGCSVLGFEWCQAQQLPCSPTALSEDAC